MANNKTKKPVEILWYSCIRRYYNIKNETTQKQEQKKMWIVIGDGHKWYRKFESQADAIKYFRKLKKCAKMRIQSVNSQEFVKNVSTFLELEKSGIEVKKIKQNNLKNNHKKWDDSKDFEDEFSKFDTFEENANNEEIQSEIDNVIREKEGDFFIGSTTELENNDINLSSNDDQDDQKEELIYIKSDLPQEVGEEKQTEDNVPIINVGENKVQEQIQEQEQIQRPTIFYSKYNPILIKKVEYGKGSKIYNFVKFSIIILMVIFGMISLWYSSQWESDSLTKLGIDFSKFYQRDPINNNIVTTDPIYVLATSNEWINATKLGLYDWKNGMLDSSIFQLLMVFSFIGVIGTIPLLVFKKGTLFSISLLFIVFASLVIVVVIFTFGMIQSNEVSSLFRNLSDKSTLNEKMLVLNIIKNIVTGIW